MSNVTKNVVPNPINFFPKANLFPFENTITIYGDWFYNIWDGSSMYFFAADLLLFTMIDCSQKSTKTPINFSD